MNNISKEMVKIAVNALNDKKAEDVKIIDISEVSTLADYFVIANGTNINQVKALADNIDKDLDKKGYPVKHVEGYQSGNWILLDYGDIIIHIFDTENRLFYNLEKMWSNGKFIESSSI